MVSFHNIFFSRDETFSIAMNASFQESLCIVYYFIILVILTLLYTEPPTFLETQCWFNFFLVFSWNLGKHTQVDWTWLDFPCLPERLSIIDHIQLPIWEGYRSRGEAGRLAWIRLYTQVMLIQSGLLPQDSRAVTWLPCISFFEAFLI